MCFVPTSNLFLNCMFSLITNHLNHFKLMQHREGGVWQVLCVRCTGASEGVPFATYADVPGNSDGLNPTPGPKRTERSHVMGVFLGSFTYRMLKENNVSIRKKRILIGQLFKLMISEVFWWLFSVWVNTSLRWYDSGGKKRNWVVTIGWALFQKYAMISGWFQEFNYCVSTFMTSPIELDQRQ